MTPLQVRVMRKFNFDFMLTSMKVLVKSCEATAPISELSTQISSIILTSIHLLQIFDSHFQRVISNPTEKVTDLTSKASSLTKMH